MSSVIVSDIEMRVLHTLRSHILTFHDVIVRYDNGSVTYKTDLLGRTFTVTEKMKRSDTPAGLWETTHSFFYRAHDEEDSTNVLWRAQELVVNLCGETPIYLGFTGDETVFRRDLILLRTLT